MRGETGWDGYHVPGSRGATPALRRSYSHFRCIIGIPPGWLIEFLLVMEGLVVVYYRLFLPDIVVGYPRRILNHCMHNIAGTRSNLVSMSHKACPDSLPRHLPRAFWRPERSHKLGGARWRNMACTSSNVRRSDNGHRCAGSSDPSGRESNRSLIRSDGNWFQGTRRRYFPWQSTETRVEKSSCTMNSRWHG